MILSQGRALILAVLVMNLGFCFGQTGTGLNGSPSPSPSVSPPIISSPSPSPTLSTSPQTSPGPSLSERRKAAFRFGIDQDVMELLKTLDAEKSDAFNDDIIKLLISTKNFKLKKAILDFFALREWKGAEDSAVQIVKNRGLEDASIVSASIAYGASIKSQAILKESLGIFTENEPGLMPALIRLAGRAGAAEEEKKLLAFFESEDSSESNKQDIILALGDIGGEDSLDFLIKIVDNIDSKKFFRMYACDSLSRLGKVEAVPVLIRAANAEDPNLRQYAVAALGRFDTPESRNMLIEALRDSYDGVRISSAKSIATLKLAEAEEILIYKVENDKSTKVKEESLKALLELGSKTAIAYAADYLKKRSNPEPLRLRALSLLLDKKDPASYDAIKEAVRAESKEKIQSLHQRMAKAVSESESPLLEDLVTGFLDSQDYIVRIYGIDWLKKNKDSGLKARLESLKLDKVEAVRKRAASIDP